MCGFWIVIGFSISIRAFTENPTTGSKRDMYMKGLFRLLSLGLRRSLNF